MKRIDKRGGAAAAVLAVIMLVVAVLQFVNHENTPSYVADGTLIMRNLYVGQANSTLINLPDGKSMLIDGGNDADGERIAEYIKDLGIKRLDFVVATHPHEDHIGGLDTIINEIDCGKIYAPKVPKKGIDTVNYEDFVAAAQRRECGLSVIQKGDVIFNENGVKIECFSPDEIDVFSDLNNYSVVTKITFGKTAVLVMGDAEKQVETLLLKSGQNLKADVLMVGHHGSSSSSTKAFIKNVAPMYAVISCGKNNSYGFPTKQTMDTLNSAGVQSFVMSEVGSVFAISDGEKVSVETYKDINLDDD